jgi:hypothetical protein
MLTQPGRAAEAKLALAERLHIPLKDATVRQARWDFAQLVDWFNYLRPRLSVSSFSADNDETINRIRLSVASVAAHCRVTWW